MNFRNTRRVFEKRQNKHVSVLPRKTMLGHGTPHHRFSVFKRFNSVTASVDE